MRCGIPILVVVMGLACGKPSEIDVRPSPDEGSRPTTASSPEDARAPAFTEHGRIAVARFDGKNLRECYDSFVATNRSPSSSPRSPDTEIPEVGVQPLALLLLDYAIVSASDSEGGGDDPKGQVTELVGTYVSDVEQAGLSAEQRASYAESARQLQAMTWPTETQEHEASTGALVKTDECTSFEQSPVAVCHVMAEGPGFVWSIQRAHFSDTSDFDIGMKWCRRHGGDWTAGDPQTVAERAEQHSRQLRELVSP